jgi:hypothetical protein
LVPTRAAEVQLRPYPEIKGHLRSAFSKALKEKTHDQRHGNGVAEDDETNADEEPT